MLHVSNPYFFSYLVYLLYALLFEFLQVTLAFSTFLSAGLVRAPYASAPELAQLSKQLL